MLAAASIKVMDALFGFLAQNDAEWTKRELLGRTWRRDWAMRRFRPKKPESEKIFPAPGKNLGPRKFSRIRCSGYLKKKSVFRLGSAFFGISDLGFLPYGVPIKGVIEKGLIFDDFFL